MYSKRSFRKNEPITIWITLPKLTKLELAGSSNIYGLNELTTNDLEIDVAGSGKIELTSVCNNLDAEIVGSWNIKLRGTANNSKIKVAGSGNFNGFDFETKDTNVEISGSGNCEITASESIDATINGSGNIYYKGTASISELNISGSGNISKK